ncbi:MAG: histidine phosphatase family protein [Synergistaceae bacterium]|jgi:alpha-ribazole phosphatase/probable phosphoglycerate mutase|nr:histidine phosphatase family protein [Synergistaceae bacterium]
MNRESRHRFFLIRHGETIWNKSFRYQGSSDTELCENGREQARKLGVRLRTTIPARVVSSPLSRAYETARIIMEHNDSSVEIEKTPDLREICFGIWEGLTPDEVKALDGEKLVMWRAAPFSVMPSEGEALEDVINRVSRAARNLIESGMPGEVTFVIAHGGSLRALLAVMMKFDDMNITWRMRMDNCSITVVDIWGGRPSLHTLNDTHHCRALDERSAEALSFPL